MPIVSVSQLNNYMKRYVEQNSNLTDLWVCGEISNFKTHYSGHIYMTLKDDNSILRAVMFNSFANKMSFGLKNGMRIIAFGKVAVFERDGSYQLYVEKIIPDGTGELYAAYEQLKSKLSAAGFFDEERKKAIPLMPAKIGVVTSLTGAAIRDVLSVSKRRFPLSDICIYPAKVQGIGAAETICKGIEYLDMHTDCDVIIVARGGGSIEDLWAFNEEKTAISIYNCNKPVISAVGHETDYTIADFVADKRAPTPSAALEIALPDIDDVKTGLMAKRKNLETAMYSTLTKCYLSLSNCGVKEIYSKAMELFRRKEILINRMQCAMNDYVSSVYGDNLNSLALLNGALETLNPLKVLKRGYSVITDAEGKYVSAYDIKEGDEINVKFNCGELNCNVRRIKYEK